VDEINLELQSPKCSGFALTDFEYGYEPHLKADLFALADAVGDINSKLSPVVSDIRVGNQQFPRQFKDPQVRAQIEAEVKPIDKALDSLLGKGFDLLIGIFVAQGKVDGAICEGLNKPAFLQSLYDDAGMLVEDLEQISKILAAFENDLGNLGFVLRPNRP
jgi:hypothetical protein